MNQLISTFSENECRKSVINYNGLSITKPFIQNEMTGKHSKPSTPPSSAVKTVEIIARDNTEIIKNDTISNRTIEKIESSISNKNESKIEEPTVNVWKKSWASLFDKDVKTISNEKIDNKINDSHVTSLKHTKVVKKIDSATHMLGGEFKTISFFIYLSYFQLTICLHLQ